MKALDFIIKVNDRALNWLWLHKWKIVVLLVIVALWANGRSARMSKDPMVQKIEKAFDSWDGSHKELTKTIKASMKNPASYEHVNTTYSVPGSASETSIIVTTTYKGANSFGAIVTNIARARCSIENGAVLEVIQ